MTTTKAYDILRKNFIIANYNSLGAVDNDDGSSYYKSESNFFVYGGGGLKNDFEGHDNWWVNNVIAFPSGPLLHNGYGGKVGDPGHGYLDGHEDGFVGNTAIVGYEGSYAKPICAGSPGTTVMNTSRVFSPKGQLTTDCGASFDVGDEDCALRADSHAGNLARLERLLPDTVLTPDVRKLAGRVAFRTATPDRMPLIGELPGQPGLYAFTGLGSRGLVWSTMGAEVIVAKLCGDPVPVESQLVSAIDPGRFFG